MTNQTLQSITDFHLWTRALAHFKPQETLQFIQSPPVKPIQTTRQNIPMDIYPPRSGAQRAPQLFLAHGLGGDRQHFRIYAEILAEIGFCVILPSFLHKDFFINGEYLWQLIAQWPETTSPIIVGGFSFGCTAVLHACVQAVRTRHPCYQRIYGMIFIDGSSPNSRRLIKTNERNPLPLVSIDTGQIKTMQELLGEHKGPLFRIGVRGRHEDAELKRASSMEKKPSETYAAKHAFLKASVTAAVGLTLNPFRAKWLMEKMKELEAASVFYGFEHRQRQILA